MEVRIEHRPAFTVAYVREYGPFLQSAAKAWERLSAWLAQSRVVDGQTDFLAMMHDDPETTPPERLRYDACVTVPAGFTSQDMVEVQEVPAGDYAVALHVGPYETLGQTWGALMPWLEQSGREFDPRPCFEIYRNDPRSTPPEELRTEVYLPLRSE